MVVTWAVCGVVLLIFPVNSDKRTWRRSRRPVIPLCFVRRQVPSPIPYRLAPRRADLAPFPCMPCFLTFIPFAPALPQS